MKRLYIVLSLFSLGETMLILTGLASLLIIRLLHLFTEGRGFLTESSVYSRGAFFLLALGGSIFLAWKKRGTLVLEAGKTRFQSFLLWENPALFFTIVLIYTSTNALEQWQLEWIFYLAESLPLLALIAAIIMPFGCGNDKFWTAMRGVSFVVNFLIILPVFVLFFLFNSQTTARSYQADNIGNLPDYQQKTVQAYIPPEASQIRLEGTNDVFTWTCHVAETDFLKFKDAHTFEFVKIEAPQDSTDQGPFPCYKYEFRRADNGGVTLCYFVPTEIMTGKYAHH